MPHRIVACVNRYIIPFYFSNLEPLGCHNEDDRQTWSPPQRPASGLRDQSHQGHRALDWAPEAGRDGAPQIPTGPLDTGHHRGAQGRTPAARGLPVAAQGIFWTDQHPASARAPVYGPGWHARSAAPPDTGGVAPPVKPALPPLHVRSLRRRSVCFTIRVV